MRGLLVIFLLTALIIRAEAQVYHSCPHQGNGMMVYENPLNEKWLSAYDVKHYNLLLEVSNKSTEISGECRVLVEATRSLDTIVFELQDALDISGVLLIEDIGDSDLSKPLGFDHRDDAVYITLNREYVSGELFSIAIFYGGEAGNNRGFFAGISNARDSDYGFDVTYTLSEPHNAKDWFPVKQVLEDKIDSVRSYGITAYEDADVLAPAGRHAEDMFHAGVPMMVDKASGPRWFRKRRAPGAPASADTVDDDTTPRHFDSIFGFALISSPSYTKSRSKCSA